MSKLQCKLNIYISYNFILYHVLDDHERVHISAGVIAGITTGCGLLVVVLAALAVYALRQKRRAEQAISLSKPFGNSLFKITWLKFEYDADCGPSFA